MKIIFFSRLDLVHLYGPLGNALKKKLEVFHVAYSDYEYKLLTLKYQVASQNIYNLKSLLEVAASKNEDEISLTVEELDQQILKYSEGRFNLNSSIASDRTFQYLDYRSCIRLCKMYYLIWDEIFSTIRPDFFLHELPALYMTQIASVLIKKYKGKYLSMIQVYGLAPYNWIILEGDNANPIELKSIEPNKETDTSLITFKSKFSEHNEPLMSAIIPKAKAKRSDFFYYIRQIRLFIKSLFYRKRKKNNEFVNHIDEFLELNMPSVFVRMENLWGEYFGNNYHEIEESDKFYYYPLHLEPEAVVLYNAGGWYKGQIKLIENIAAQLPSDYFLYVKDHPHGGRYRNQADFNHLGKIPNVKVIQPTVDGKSLIKRSSGVITINGTSGFEAILLKKHVICFGHAFYSRFEGVHYVEHIKNLRPLLYEISKKTSQFNDENLKSYLSISHPGFISFFANRHVSLGVDLVENARIVAEELEISLNRIYKTVVV